MGLKARSRRHSENESLSLLGIEPGRPTPGLESECIDTESKRMLWINCSQDGTNNLEYWTLGYLRTAVQKLSSKTSDGLKDGDHEDECAGVADCFEVSCWRTAMLHRNQNLQVAPWRHNQKVHRRVYNSPPTIPILSQVNPLHTLPANLPKIHSNPILPSTPRSFKWSLSLGLPHHSLVHFTVPCVPHAPPTSLSLIWPA
jgi:hypothetical protein